MLKSDVEEPWEDFQDSCQTNKQLAFVLSAPRGFYAKTFTIFSSLTSAAQRHGYMYSHSVTVIFCFVQPQNAVSKVPEDSPCFSSK